MLSHGCGRRSSRCSSDCGHVAARYPGRLSGLLHRRDDALLACIASNSTRDASSHQLEAFVIHGREKHLIATLRSPEPFGAIALHPSRNVVYAAYDTKEYLGLPGASIIEINSQSGRLGEASRRLFLDPANLSRGYHHHGPSDRINVLVFLNRRLVTKWRRERDSNPRSPLGLSGFQDRLFQPLTHPSARACLLLYKG